jgi:hypothetical protein
MSNDRSGDERTDPMTSPLRQKRQIGENKWQNRIRITITIITYRI